MAEEQQDSTTTETTETAGTPGTEQQESTETTEQGTSDEQHSGAPETYTDFTLPEGVPIDKELLNAVLPVFKEAGLTQEQAQRLITFHGEGAKLNAATFEADKNSRVEAIKNDKEVGGENFTQASETMGRALSQFLNDSEQAELKAYVDRFGPSPILAKLMYRVGKGMTEDSRMERGNNARAEPDQATILKNMYPSMF